MKLWLKTKGTFCSIVAVRGSTISNQIDTKSLVFFRLDDHLIIYSYRSVNNLDSSPVISLSLSLTLFLFLSFSIFVKLKQIFYICTPLDSRHDGRSAGHLWDFRSCSLLQYDVKIVESATWVGSTSCFRNIETIS